MTAEQKHRKAGRHRWYGLLLIMLLPLGALGAAVGYALNEAARVHKIVDGDCPAWRAIGTVPLPPSAAPVAHQFVDAGRGAYNGRCIGVMGTLPPAPTITPTPGR